MKKRELDENVESVVSHVCIGAGSGSFYVVLHVGMSARPVSMPFLTGAWVPPLWSALQSSSYQSPTWHDIAWLNIFSFGVILLSSTQSIVQWCPLCVPRVLYAARDVCFQNFLAADSDEIFFKIASFPWEEWFSLDPWSSAATKCGLCLPPLSSYDLLLLKAEWKLTGASSIS